MHIAQLVDDLDFGGLQRIVVDLSIQMKKRGHAVTIICLRKVENGARAQGPQDAGVQVIALDKPEGFHLATLRKLIDCLKTEQVQVLNSHNHLVHHYAVLAACRAAVPVVLNTLHGTATLDMPSWAKLLYWGSCLASDGVVSVSPEVRRVFRRKYPVPKHKLVVIDNGIDLSPFIEVRHRRTDGKLILGSVGRLVPGKDYANLLRAFAIVRRRYPATRLRILGGGPCEPALRRLSEELGSSDQVEFCGFSNDVPAFLSGIDIYVSSSLSEGLPVSMIEAIAAGLPVVSTAVGGVVGLAEKTGSTWLCRPASATALATALQDALAAPDRPLKASRARESVLRYYSADRMAAEYERLYGVHLARSHRKSTTPGECNKDASDLPVTELQESERVS